MSGRGTGRALLAAVAVLAPVGALRGQDGGTDLELRVQRLEAQVDEFFRDSLRWQWRDGFRAETPDRRFRLRIGGFMHNDWAWIHADRATEAFTPPGAGVPLGNQQDGVEMRRARLGLSGLLWTRLEFRLRFNFSGGSTRPSDVYGGLIDLPHVGGIRIGHMKEPFSLQALTSANATLFMERSLINVFAPMRNTGAMLHNNFFDQRMTAALFAGRDTDSFGEGKGDGDSVLTGRVTLAPVYRDDGATVVHLGAGFSYRGLDSFSFEEHPEIHLADDYIDLDLTETDHGTFWNVEGAVSAGPFSVQGEYTWVGIERDGASHLRYGGGYLEGSWIVTGERRRYDRVRAVFRNPRPARRFLDHGGPGAWQLKARWTRLDLDDDGVDGGRFENIALGVNWYLNPSSRVMFEWVNADIQDVGDTNAFQMRFQVNF